MAVATFWQKGAVIDYKNETGAEIPMNTVVNLTTRIGITGAPIPAGEVGALYVENTWKVKKATGSITIGALVYYDPVADNFTTTKTSNVLAGWAVAPAAADDTEVTIKLQG